MRTPKLFTKSKTTSKTRKNTSNGSKKTLWGRITEKRRRRVEQRRAARQEAAITWAKGNQIHALPVVIDVMCLLVALVATLGTLSAAVGIAALGCVAFGASCWFLLDARREHTLVFTHLAVGSVWGLASHLAGLAEPMYWAAGVIIALGAQVSWLDQRSAKKNSPKVKVARSLAEQWNDAENGILVRSGVKGARMYSHAPIRNNDGVVIGDSFEIDLTGSDTGQDAFEAMGQRLAEKMPGKVRRGAVNIVGDPDEVNHATVRAIWVSSWKSASEDPKGIITHPVVEYLPKIQEIVLNAIERRKDPSIDTVEIPDYVKMWLPQMRSYADPVPMGQHEDRSTFWMRNYKRKFGVTHLFCVAETGGGKTSFVNGEIASEMPCRDVLFWVIDVSTKKGQDYTGWGSCIDWLATDAEEAVKMLKAARRVAAARGEHYKDAAGSVRSPKQAPTIKLIVDELSALYDELDTEAFELLNPLTRQGRSQGVQVQMYDQSAEQVGNLYGIKQLMRQMHRRAVLKVADTGNLSNVMRMPGSVPYDMSVAPEGVIAFEDHQSPRPELFRCYYVDTGDPDEDDHGVIPALASVYAPFRPALDEVSAHSAGSDYAERAMTREDNPLLTPEEVVMSHAPVNPVLDDDDLAENYANIRTGADWIDALLRGDLHMSTPDTSVMPADDTHGGDSPDDSQAVIDAVLGSSNSVPADGEREWTPVALLKNQGVPTSTGERARQERRQMMQQRHQQAKDELDALFGEADQMNIPDDNPNLDILEAEDPPQNYPDSDKIMAAALELLRTQASKGTTTRDIAEAAGGVKRDTVMLRMRWLVHTGRAVQAGKTKGSRWYSPDCVPFMDGEQGGGA